MDSRTVFELDTAAKKRYSGLLQARGLSIISADGLDTGPGFPDCSNIKTGIPRNNYLDFWLCSKRSFFQIIRH